MRRCWRSLGRRLLRGGSDGDVIIVESDILIEYYVKMCFEC